MIHFHTAVRGAEHIVIQRKLQPRGMRVDRFPMTINHDKARIRLAAAYAQALPPDDVLVAVEADMQFKMDIPIPTDRVTVERADATLKSMVSTLPDETAPWAGFVSCPVKWAAELFTAWAEGFEVTKLHPALWSALQRLELPWELRTDTAFWPSKAAITHYRGRAAHKEVLH